MILKKSRFMSRLVVLSIYIVLCNRLANDLTLQSCFYVDYELTTEK